MKRFFAIAIALLLALTIFSACSGKKENSGTSGEGSSTSNKKNTAAASDGGSGTWPGDIDWEDYGLSGIIMPKGTELKEYDDYGDSLYVRLSNGSKNSFSALQTSIEKFIGKQKDVRADDAQGKNYRYTYEYSRKKMELELSWYPSDTNTLNIIVSIVEWLPEEFDLSYIGLSKIKQPEGPELESFSVSDDKVYGYFNNCNNNDFIAFQTAIQTAVEGLNGKLTVRDSGDFNSYNWSYKYSEMDIRLTLSSRKDRPENMTLDAQIKNFPSELKEVSMTGLSGSFSSFELNSDIYHRFSYDPGYQRGRFRIEWDDSACGDEIDIEVFGPHGLMSSHFKYATNERDKPKYFEFDSSSYTPNQNAVCVVSVLYKRCIDDSMRWRKSKDYVSGTYTMRGIKIGDY